MEDLPEAPTFYPTAAEFSDPLAYIERIGAHGGRAAAAGLCKIVPPAGSFVPRFVRGGDAFVFRPRRQPLAELGARTRVHRLFLDDLQRYWMLRGFLLDLHTRPPTVDRKPLDLHALRHAVAALGGPDAVTARKLWAAVARALHVASPTCTSASSTLRALYDKWIRPFDDFLQSSLAPSSTKTSLSNTSSPKSSSPKSSSPKSSSPKSSSPKSSSPKSADQDAFDQTLSDSTVSRCGPPMKRLRTPTVAASSGSSSSTKEHQTSDYSPDNCFQCDSKFAQDASTVTCSACMRSCHSSCADPPMLPPTYSPIGTHTSEWHCLACLVREFKELQSEPYGFVDSSYDHTLRSFGIAASKFKADYFKMTSPPSPIPGELSKESLPIPLVEKEFWRLIESPDSNVEVEYGSDIHSSSTGSGFPFKPEDIQSDTDRSISQNPWNLNVLSKQYLSLLPYFDDNIPGMMVPWIYVGMCFSNFCWHNEDHYTYSINYLHWGEPKTWYGVSGAETDKFERAMRNLAPELFQKHPDLLQHLVTMVSPLDLVKQGIKVYRLDQRKGEFVITFPSAYHAGFNHGFNFAEAVNFALPDWLPWGRKAVDLYSRISRNTVFSHEELVFMVAQKHGDLCDGIINALLQEMQVLWSTYQEKFQSALASGIKETQHVVLEKVDDESRTCLVCHTTCFLGCVVCRCSSDQLVCLKHVNKLCQCPSVSKTIQYRYTSQDYSSLVSQMHSRLSSINEWVSLANILLHSDSGQQKKSLDEAKTLLEKGKRIGLHLFKQKAFVQLQGAIQEVDIHDKLGQRVLQNVKSLESVQIKTEQESTENIAHWLKVADNLPFIVPCYAKILQIKSDLLKFQAEARSMLSSPYLNRKNAENLILTGRMLERHFEVPELRILQQYVDRIKWQEDASVVNADPPTLDMTGLAMLIQRGLRIEVDQPLIRPLKILHATAERWVAKAVRVLTSRSEISTLHSLIQDASSIPLILVEVREIQQIISTAEAVRSSAKMLLSDQSLAPKLAELSGLYEKVQHLPIKSDEILQQLKRNVEKGKVLVSRMNKLFHKKGSTDSLDSLLSHQLELKAGLRKTLKERRRVSSEDHEAGRDCICGKPATKSDSVCFICQRSFHSKCIKSLAKDKTPSRYFCSACRKTSRPPLSALQTLLQESQAVRIELEGFAIAKEVCNIAVYWAQKAQQLLDKQTSPRRKDIERLIAEGEMIEIEIPEQILLDDLLRKCPNESESSDSKNSPLQDTKSAHAASVPAPNAPMKLMVMEGESIQVAPLTVAPIMVAATTVKAKVAVATPTIHPTSVLERKQGICICHQPFDPYESHTLVRCLDCAGWFHMDCLGITQRPPLTEGFLCPYCTHRSAAPSLHQSPWS